MGGKGNQFKELSGVKATNLLSNTKPGGTMTFIKLPSSTRATTEEHWKSLTPEAFDSVSTNS